MPNTSDWTAERISAIARLVVLLASAVAGGFGLTVDPDALGTIAACAVALVAGVWGWWKNNNLTKAAQDAQAYLDAIKGNYEAGKLK